MIGSQVSALLEFCLATDGEAVVNKTLADSLIHLARTRDEALRGEGLEVRVEEDVHPELLFHIPGEGYSERWSPEYLGSSKTSSSL